VLLRLEGTLRNLEGIKKAQVFVDGESWLIEGVGTCTFHLKYDGIQHLQRFTQGHFYL
jgi:hypothetical protein